MDVRKRNSTVLEIKGIAFCSNGEENEKVKLSRRRGREAHLTVAITWEDYSIALTKCFQNTVKLQQKETQAKREMKQGREKFT